VELLPDIPTVTESGYQDYEVNIWFGVLAPKETPQETLPGGALLRKQYDDYGRVIREAGIKAE
jgi:tripartite-type tricarboxylate transporter receptor subunit TctC